MKELKLTVSCFVYSSRDSRRYDAPYKHLPRTRPPRITPATPCLHLPRLGLHLRLGVPQRACVQTPRRRRPRGGVPCRSKSLSPSSSLIRLAELLSLRIAQLNLICRADSQSKSARNLVKSPCGGRFSSTVASTAERLDEFSSTSPFLLPLPTRLTRFRGRRRKRRGPPPR